MKKVGKVVNDDFCRKINRGKMVDVDYISL